jgi:5-methyltetrahydropteroyltriglutamate--homocysteine methyltransferase
MPEAPFRADQVGSLLRTKELKAARSAREEGDITGGDLKAVEDREIRKLIARQEETGLRAVTDGEFRRSMWHYDFLECLDGVEAYQSEQGIAFKGGIATKAKSLRVTGKLGFSGHPMIEHFRFLMENARVTPKMTIPSPSVLHFRGGRKAVSEIVYPDLGEFFHDLGLAYQKVVKAFAEAGCRYLQFDETNLAYLCDPEQCRLLRERGDDPGRLPFEYAAMINTAIAGRPADMRITMHLCRGNFRSSFIASGGYEPVADMLFNRINVDGYFMEWDTERAGGFEPLRLLPRGKMVVLGLVTSKAGTLESTKDLKRRIHEAASFVDLDQLCLSPQCGFASTEEGNTLAEDEQWAKLERIVEIARELWGGV